MENDDADENSFSLSSDRVFETNEPVLHVINGTTWCRNARHTNPGYDQNDTYAGWLGGKDGERRETNGK